MQYVTSHVLQYEATIYIELLHVYAETDLQDGHYRDIKLREQKLRFQCFCSFLSKFCGKH